MFVFFTLYCCFNCLLLFYEIHLMYETVKMIKFFTSVFAFNQLLCDSETAEYDEHQKRRSQLSHVYLTCYLCSKNYMLPMVRKLSGFGKLGHTDNNIWILKMQDE